MGNKLGKRKDKRGKVELVSVTKKQTSRRRAPTKEELDEQQQKSTEASDTGGKHWKEKIADSVTDETADIPQHEKKSTEIPDASGNNREDDEITDLVAGDTVKCQRVIEKHNEDGIDSDELTLYLDGSEDYVMRFYDDILAEAFKDLVEKKKQLELDAESEKMEKTKDEVEIENEVSKNKADEKNIQNELSEIDKNCVVENDGDKEKKLNFCEDNATETIEIDCEKYEIDDKDITNEHTPESNENEGDNEAEIAYKNNKNDENDGEIQGDNDKFEHETYLHYGERLSTHIMTHVKLHLA